MIRVTVNNLSDNSTDAVYEGVKSLYYETFFVHWVGFNVDCIIPCPSVGGPLGSTCLS